MLNHKYRCCKRPFVLQLDISSSNGQWICSSLLNFNQKWRTKPKYSYLLQCFIPAVFLCLCHSAFSDRPVASDGKICPCNHFHYYFGVSRRLKRHRSPHMLICVVSDTVFKSHKAQTPRNESEIRRFCLVKILSTVATIMKLISLWATRTILTVFMESFVNRIP